MADILHDFPVAAPPSRVFEMFATPAGLDRWWTLGSSGGGAVGSDVELSFGPPYEWRGRVTRCIPDREYELEMTVAMREWQNTRVGVRLEPSTTGTMVYFRHTGWPHESDHFRTTSYCWAMYLRILKRNLEHGETVPYERRLDV